MHSECPVMIELRDIDAGYGRVPVLRKFGFSLAPGEVIAVSGPNGAGKSTLLRVLAGVLLPWKGSVHYGSEDISNEGAQLRAQRGIILCPEGRRIFSSLSIEENLLIGATAVRSRNSGRSREVVRDGLERAYSLFPVLKERRSSSGGALSGGQQQMLAIARALMAQPRVLLLDEPSLGLSPLIADEVYASLATLRRSGLAMMIVEEAGQRPLELADRGLLMRRGEIVREATAARLLEGASFASDYFGHVA
jgi:branched-chain amino acid transport system ATP-binding protein